MTVEEFWQTFLKETSLPADTVYTESFHFDLDEKSANGLLALVLCGKKRATSSSLYAFSAQGNPIPKPGDYSIVTDWSGTPRCVIRTQSITCLPFRDMTFTICRREGEDENLDSWKRSHTHFFTEEGKQLGYSFSEDMPVIFEDFEVVYQK